ncbi:hypothetical protein [Pseudohoeflea coraliihabitans]|uniref:hypothetical protein n=1 Tax=Pseudohoeflea coraliihabitans TaxID=2860393 RepID=UPI0021026E5A|nr:hypothetical protein [Pseudohoeflea sp. DP4N28-3]
MADFVGVIRKAVDNLSENTPENRQRVYGKARTAIRRQLEAMSPRPSEELLDRQLAKLDDAIEEVESEHTAALPPEAAETEQLMAELEALVEDGQPQHEAPGAGNGPYGESYAAPAPAYPPAAAPSPQQDYPPAEDYPPQVEPGHQGQQPMPHGYGDDPAYAQDEDDYDGQVDVSPGGAAGAHYADPHHPVVSGEDHDEVFGLGTGDREAAGEAGYPQVEDGRRSGGLRGGMTMWVLGLVVLVLLAGAGYAAYSQRDALTALFGGGDDSVAVAPNAPTVDTQPDSGTEATTPGAGGEAADSDDAPTELAAVDPQAPVESDGKFTQRLNADGTESDPGPAPQVADAGPVEGRSLAAQSDSADAPAASADAGAEDSDSPPAAAISGEEPAAAAASSADSPLGVAQKMFLYEERLDQQAPAVTEGTVVWSVIPDTENGGANNVAIRGEISSGTGGLSALITIKRNSDPSLPASHIIELVFALPDGFGGGAIDQVQRVAMKQTEQDQGNPLIAVPAKITQDFYMIALNDLAAATNTNLALLRERNWIDIPVVYTNGRRALLTLEKGASGSEAFNEALDVWAAG